MSKKKPDSEKEKPYLVGITRYFDKDLAEMVDRAAKRSGQSIAAYQRDAMYQALEKEFGEEFREKLDKSRQSGKRDRWKWIKGLRKKKAEDT